jgi:hypothetical protein
MSSTKEFATPPSREVPWDVFEIVNHPDCQTEEWRGAVVAKTWFYARQEGMARYQLHPDNIHVKWQEEVLSCPESKKEDSTSSTPTNQHTPACGSADSLALTPKFGNGKRKTAPSRKLKSTEYPLKKSMTNGHRSK